MPKSATATPAKNAMKRVGCITMGQGTIRPGWGGFFGVEPLALKYLHLSSFTYSNNNPITFFDSDGRELFIHGQQSLTALEELKKVTELPIEYDETKNQVFVSGVVDKDFSPVDNKLLEAIDSDKVKVNLITQKELHFTTQEGVQEVLIIGAFDGSRIAAGKVQTKQHINMEHILKEETGGGNTSGVTVLHEVIESYIAGDRFPGEPYSEQNLEYSHEEAISLDDRFLRANTTRDIKTQEGVIVYGVSIGNNEIIELEFIDAQTGKRIAED